MKKMNLAFLSMSFLLVSSKALALSSASLISEENILLLASSDVQLLQGKTIHVEHDCDDRNVRDCTSTINFSKVTDHSATLKIKLFATFDRSSGKIVKDKHRILGFTINVNLEPKENGRYIVTYTGGDVSAINKPSLKMRMGVSQLKLPDTCIHELIDTFSFIIENDQFIVKNRLGQSKGKLMQQLFKTEGIPLE